ncbi:MAG: hypothetical protein V3T43_06160 [Nitrosomonadaceae bacterium]
MNIREIQNKIAAPVGSINMNVEPKTFGYLLEGLGDLTSGVYFKSSDADNGDIAVGDTIDNGSSGTGTVAAIIAEEDIIIATGVSGDWATSDTIGNSGTHSSTLQTFDATIFAHLIQFPDEMDNSWSLQKNFTDRAIRYMGVKFHAVDSFAQSDNILTASVKLMARSAFRHARVGTALTSGSGSKVIAVDQTQGLVAGDSIKVYRPGTGFIDFSASAVKTHTIDSIVADTSVTVTLTQANINVGDLIMLAPITPSYTVDEEFAWIGNSQVAIGVDKDNLTSFDAQDYTMVLTQGLEERHAASGTNIQNRMPTDLLQTGFTASGSFKLHNENEDYYRSLRLNTAQSVRLTTTGNQIASTGINFQLIVTYTEVQFDQYQTSIATDEIINEEVPFTSFYNATAGFSVQIILVNDIATY